jgi:hypothetical protein
MMMRMVSLGVQRVGFESVFQYEVLVRVESASANAEESVQPNISADFRVVIPPRATRLTAEEHSPYSLNELESQSFDRVRAFAREIIASENSQADTNGSSQRLSDQEQIFLARLRPMLRGGASEEEIQPVIELARQKGLDVEKVVKIAQR